MATILVPTNRATLALAYTAAVNGDTIVLETAGPHLLPATLNKVLNFTSTVDAVVLAATGSSSYGIRAQSTSSLSTFSGLVVDGGTVARVAAESGVTISLTDCDILEDTTTNSASYEIYAQPSSVVNFEGGSLDTRAYAARVQSGAECNISDATITTSNQGAAVRHLWLEATAGGGKLTVYNCDIDSGTSIAAVETIVAGAVGALTLEVTNSRITHANTDGHTLGAGSESTVTGGNGQVAYDFSRNVITGFRGVSGDTAGIIHTIFVGFNANGPIDANTIIGGGYAIAWKGKSTANTTGYVARNLALNANLAIRIKGIDGAIIINNTGITKGVNSGVGFMISDNDGAGSANNAVHVGNVYCVVNAQYVASKRGVCSFALNKNNCYMCNSLTAFTIDDVEKTWAEWVAATGETDSFCVVKNGAAWDVYTSAAPTVVAWSLSACPIDTTTGRIADIPKNPLIKAGAVVTGVNDGSELDIWGNATAAMPNIGADQYDYAPGFGPWSQFDATMPTLALAPTAPGDLRSVQTWTKVATAKEIERVK